MKKNTTTIFFSRRAVLVCAFAITLTVLIVWVQYSKSFKDKPCADPCNVILIMVDTLPAGHLKTYGYERDTLPKTTGIFEREGVIFDNAQSAAPWTLPSFISIYFSDIASRITYAELENKKRASLISQLRHSKINIRAVVPGARFFIIDGITRVFQSDEIVRQKNNEPAFLLAERELSRLSATSTPFFLLVHTFKAHDPYIPRAPHDKYFGETSQYPQVTMKDLLEVNVTPDLINERKDVYRLRYDQNLSQLDAEIASFIEGIPDSLRAQTVIILSSDHGEAFGEHGYVYHAVNLYQEELHVPLMMIAPGIKPHRITEPVSLLDLAPTILGFQNIPSVPSFKGLNLLPLLQGESLGKERQLLAVNGMPFFLQDVRLIDFIKNPPVHLSDLVSPESQRPIIEADSIGVRLGDFKYWVTLQKNREPQKRYFFNLKRDPRELNNLSENRKFPEYVADLLLKLL